MKCIYCDCDCVETLSTFVVNHNENIIIVRNVPCFKCKKCEEKYYSDEVSEKLENLVMSAKKLMQEIAVMDYSVAV